MMNLLGSRRLRVALLCSLLASLALMAPGKARSASPAAKKICKIVTKKVHGKKQRFKVCRPVPTATPTVTPTFTPLPSVAIPNTLDLFVTGNHTSCAPSGAASTTFPYSTTEIFARATMKQRVGQHFFAWEWIAPDCTLYSENGPTVETNIGAAVLCPRLPSQRNRPAGLRGAWTRH